MQDESVFMCLFTFISPELTLGQLQSLHHDVIGSWKPLKCQTSRTVVIIPAGIDVSGSAGAQINHIVHILVAWHVFLQNFEKGQGCPMYLEDFSLLYSIFADQNPCSVLTVSIYTIVCHAIDNVNGSDYVSSSIRMPSRAASKRVS